MPGGRGWETELRGLFFAGTSDQCFPASVLCVSRFLSKKREKNKSRFFAHHPRIDKRSGLRFPSPATKTCRRGPRFAPDAQEIRWHKISELAAAAPRWQVGELAQDPIYDNSSFAFCGTAKAVPFQNRYTRGVRAHGCIENYWGQSANCTGRIRYDLATGLFGFPFQFRDRAAGGLYRHGG